MSEKVSARVDVGILVGRVGLGLAMIIGHGWPKLSNFSMISEKFPALFGMSSSVCLGLAVFAEFFCAILLVLGLLTRFSLIQLIATMAVGMYTHLIVWDQALFAKPGEPSGEMALVYMIPFIVLFILGPGRISLDQIIRSKKGSKSKKK